MMEANKQIHNYVLPIGMMVTILLLMCSIVPLPITSAMSLVVALAGLVYIAYAEPIFILKYLYYMVPIVLNIAGVAVCEFTHIYLDELRCETGYVGSLPLIVLSRWIMVLVLLWIDSKYRNKSVSSAAEPDERLVSLVNGLSIVVVLLGIVFMLDAMRQAPAFLMGNDRFTWRNEHESFLPRILNFVYELLLIAPFYSIMYGKKVRGIAAISLYTLYSLWTGAKYGPFLYLFCVFIWVFQNRIAMMGSSVIRKSLLAATLFVTVLAVSAGLLQTNYVSTDKDLGEYINQRLAQQGQLWWKTYDINGTNPHPYEFSNEIKLWGTEGPADKGLNADTGIYLIMYLCSPAGRVNSMISRGVNMTEAGYASSLYYFGVIGPIAFSLIIGMVGGLIIESMLVAIEEARIIDALVLSRTTTVLGKLLAAFRWGVFEPLSILCYAYLLFSSLIRKNSRANSDVISIEGDKDRGAE